MKENFDYKEVPQNYLHCLNTSCSRASDCLRFRVGTCVDKETSYFTIVNPTHSAEKACTYFQLDSLIRYAVGITHLYERLPLEKYRKIKKLIHNYFGHSHYYRIYNKLRFINPRDQAFIRELFIKEGIEFEPAFDDYVERYDFFHVEE